MQRLLIVLVAASALMAGLFLSARHYAEPETGSSAPGSASLIGMQRPDFELGSNTGEIMTAADFHGKTLLISWSG